MKNGFSVLEVILAVALFMIFSTGAVMTVVQGYNANRLGTENTVANQFAAEGIEAVKSIKNQDFANLNAVNNQPRGLMRNGSNVWAFDIDGTSDTLEKYTRTVKVESVNRNAVPPAGDIVPSGSPDPDTKKITSTVTWNFNSARPETTTLVSYLSDWIKPIVTNRGGILVYGDGGTTSDSIKYKILNTSTGTWSAAASAADIDGATNNKALRVVRVYASSTRNEKIAISRHYNGSAQFIYAQVFNGTTWGNVIQLATWTATTFLDVYNFDGAYLNNGNFMAVYSDNTITPKARIWNNSSWLDQTSTANMGGIPNNIVLRNRTGTNELLMATFDQTNDTNTSYFDGSVWSTAIEHSALAPVNTKEFVDFTWSAQSSSKGALIYSNSSTDKSMNIRICTAPCGSSASWSTTQNTSNQGTLGAMEIDSRLGAEEFLACDKDASNDIYCFKSNSTPAWTNPTNQRLTATTDTGIQRSFDTAFEAASGTEGISVYSDTTNIPKLKIYTASSNTFDATATNLNTLGGVLKTVKLRPVTENDDIMILMGDVNRTLYTVVWNGSANSVYTTPSGKAFSTHGTNGSLATEYWFGFAWDKF